MAVTTQKIKDRFKLLYPSVNLSAKRLDEISAKLSLKPADDAKDEDIDTVIKDFNDILSFEDIAKQDDRERGLEAKVKKNDDTKSEAEKAEEAKKAAEAKKKADESQKDMPEWAKSFQEGITSKFDKMSGDIDSLKTGTVADKKLQTAKDLFGESEILKDAKPEIQESWLKRVDLSSETSIEDQVKGLETEYSTLVQSNADGIENASAPPTGLRTKGKPSQAQIDEVLDQM